MSQRPPLTSGPTMPPGELELQAAMAWLDDVVDYRRAALHLASPVDVIPSVAMTLTDSESTWRGAHAVAGHGYFGSSKEAACLVAAGHRGGDVYLDLSSHDPVMWCKPLVSGHRKILFGVGPLFNGPVFNADPSVSDDAMREGLRWWLAERSAVGEGSGGTVISGPNESTLIWVTPKTVYLEPSSRETN